MSTTPFLYGNCLYGIGNRVTVICATYACAKLRGLEPVFFWESTWDCQCEYHDVFEPHPLVTQVDKIREGGEIFSACVYYPEWMPQHLYGARLEALNDSYWEAWRECARQFRLRRELALPERSAFVAVHVRENDHLRAEGRHLKLNDLPAFVACDAPSLKAKIADMMPSAWSLDTKIADQDYGEGCRTLDHMKDAARDMMMLTRASVILTIGRDSTFRNLAVFGYEIPCFKFYHGLSP